MTEALPAPGTKLTVQWVANPKSVGVKSNQIGEKRSQKIILPSTAHIDGPGPQPGQTWLCQVERITNPKSDRRGAIIVRPIRQQLDCTCEDVWIDPKQKSLMSVVLQNPDRNLFMKGLQGVGKTTIAEALARQLGWEFFKIEGSQIQKYTQFYGRVQSTLAEGQLRWEWFDSPLATLIRFAQANPQKIVLGMVDELSRIERDAQNVLLPVISGKARQLQTNRPETLEVPFNIRWMFAANLGEGFNVQEMDAALMDRLEVFEIAYMPYEEEVKHCLKRYPSCPRQPLESALKIVHCLRRVLVAKMRIFKAVSTRRSEAISMFLSEGVEIEPAMLTSVANHFDGWSTDPASQCSRVAEKIKAAIAGKDIEKE